MSNKLDALAEGHIGPVGSFGIVEVIGVQQGMEDIGLVCAHVVTDVDLLGGLMLASHVGAMGCGNTIVPKGLWGFDVVGHGGG